MNPIHKIIKILTVLFFTGLVSSILYLNFAPLGAVVNYELNGKDNSRSVSMNGLSLIGQVIKQVGDTAYFKVNSPISYEKAKVKITYRADNNQLLKLGYRDEKSWHYTSTTVNAPILNTLAYPKIGNGPFLYQKVANFKTVNDFLLFTPEEKLIGVYDYDATAYRETIAGMSGYKPSKNETLIETPLKGRVVMYVYLDNEPFKLRLSKKDLNLKDGPDVVRVKILKQNEIVLKGVMEDDGDVNQDGSPGLPDDIELTNPGPGLPESGIYKIIIDASDDSVITSISTNLNKVVFQGPLQLTSEGGGDKNPQKIQGLSNIYTNAVYLSISSTGLSRQVSINDRLHNTSLSNHIKIPLAPSRDLTTLRGSWGDMKINGVGFFSFEPKHFFSPTSFKILPINDSSDLGIVDYVLTNYAGAPKQEGEWKVAEREFDLRDAVIQKGKLSWLISAPGLKESGRTIEIKSIEMTLTKKGWFDK